MDIAELGYKVDSSGLLEGTKALDENAAAADKAGAAAERLEKSQKGTGKSASFWANEQAKINARVQEMEQIEQRAGRATQQAARATEARELNLQKLLGQINPTVSALAKLADQEDKLARARDLGLLKPQVWQQYQTQLDATRARVMNTAQGTDVLSGRLGQLNLRAVETQQSIVALFRALASGDIGQAQGSITSLTARTGALNGVMTATGLAVGAAVLALAGLSAIAVTGYMELRKLEGQVAATGTAAGLTAGQLLAMRKEIGSASGSYKEAGAAIEQLVQQGNASGQTLQLMASAAVNLADLTGSSISSTVGEVRSLAEGGADALVKLNDRYNFLTPEIYRHIEAIREQRGDYAATEAALEQLDGTMRDRASSMADSAGVVEKAWKGALAALEDTWEKIKGIGRDDFDSQIERAKKNIEYFQALQRSPIPGDASRGSAGESAARQRIAQLQQWKAEMADGAAIIGQVHKYDRDVIAAERELARERAVADEAVKARMAGLDREAAKRQAINKIIADYNKLADNDARHFDGSMQRLIAKAEADVDKSFNRSEGVGRRNGDDSAARNILASAQRQIEANKQLVDTGVKVTDSERQAMAIEQLLAKSKNTMTDSTRTLLEAAKQELLTSGQKATAYTKEKEAAEALARQQAILAQAGANRDRANELDLMGMGRGSDAVAMLRRQLDIQREYQDELKRLGSRDVAKDKETWDLMAANAAAFRDTELAKERTFQEQRLAMLGDWRAGVRRAWEDYSFAAGNALEQANGLMNTALSGWEDAWVRFAQTGKLSFRDMANAIIADLARIAAKQAAVGIINAVASAWGGGGGGGTYTGDGTGAGSIGGFGNNLANFGGGRAKGGPVRGSTLYEVGEGGRPELFSDGRGRTYLIPGNDGQVIPAAAGASGGPAAAAGPAQINVQVVVNSDGSTDADGDTALMQQFGQELGRFVESKYRELQTRDLRPGGTLHAMGARA
ncbi:phage tail tape measure C-terminal domain-containing protein [Stenotrophomonas tuberculopleuritidis]|uniref:phage tail tape measure C-terminal domain-containing protein n=1 Tax=Stenotrophomonas tuberculopleuritidis TaxID=3055079 RepID=UPI0026E5652F|nr:phage tail tape measure C-terminal domain-containing protein [Stenotrophomonas sp. 704A1]